MEVDWVFMNLSGKPLVELLEGILRNSGVLELLWLGLVVEWLEVSKGEECREIVL